MQRGGTNILSISLTIGLLLSSVDATAAPQVSRDMETQALSLAAVCAVHGMLDRPPWKTILLWILNLGAPGILGVPASAGAAPAGARAEPSRIFIKTAELSPHQADVLHRRLLGQHPKQIAFALKLSPRTIEFHLSRIQATLKAHDYHPRLGAFQAGWVQHEYVRDMAEILVNVIVASFTITQLHVLTTYLRHRDKNYAVWGERLGITRRTIEFHLYSPQENCGINENIALYVPQALAYRVSLSSPIRDILLGIHWNWEIAAGYLLTPEAADSRQQLFNFEERFVKTHASKRRLVRAQLREDA